MQEKIVIIPNISCHHCIHTIKTEIGEIEGVQTVEGDVQEKSVRIVWNTPATWEKIDITLTEIGYSAKSYPRE